MYENRKRSSPQRFLSVLYHVLPGHTFALVRFVRLRFFGDMAPIPAELRALAHETDEISDHLPDDYFQANVCLNYGGRDEILRAARKFAAACAAGERKPEELDENGNPIVRERKERKHKDKGPRGEKKSRHSEDNEIHGDKVPASMGTSIGDILASKLQGMPEVLSAGAAEEEAPADGNSAE